LDYSAHDFYSSFPTLNEKKKPEKENK
jgi:hypothetical protein